MPRSASLFLTGGIDCAALGSNACFEAALAIGILSHGVLIADISPTFSTRGKRRAKSIGVYRKSPLQDWDLGASGPLRGRDARRWLRRQIELELLEQQLLVGIELSIAAEDQHASVGCREVHVEHLHRGHLVEHRP